MATTGLFNPVAIGARGQQSSQLQVPIREDSYDGSQGLMALQQLKAQQQQRNQQQSQGFGPRNFNQPAASPTPAPAPTGSSLVAGGPGTGLGASFASNFGLGGAVQSGALGSYGGATGLFGGTGAGAGWSGLGAASSGLTYGGGSAAAGSAAGAGSGWFGLGGASTGLSYGGGAAAAGGAGAGGGAALLSNPLTAAAAAVLGSANYLHNKGISSWSDTLKGKAPGNIVDYFQGRQDGKEHGFMSKVLDKDTAHGKFAKSFTDLATLDFGNAFKGATGGLKDLFSFKWF